MGPRLRSGNAVIDWAFAQQFAMDWIDAWNEHDLDRLLRHFSGDFEAWAPAVALVSCDSAGILRSKAEVMASWGHARQLIRDVRFELISTLVGETSVTLYYKGVRGRLAAETFCFGPDLKVVRVLTMLGDALAAWAISERTTA